MTRSSAPAILTDVGGSQCSFDLSLTTMVLAAGCPGQGRGRLFCFYSRKPRSEKAPQSTIANYLAERRQILTVQAGMRFQILCFQGDQPGYEDCYVLKHCVLPHISLVGFSFRPAGEVGTRRPLFVLRGLRSPREREAGHEIDGRNRYSSMISFKPSTTDCSSSGDNRPIKSPRRSVDSVRIWLILTQERFGKGMDQTSRARG